MPTDFDHSNDVVGQSQLIPPFGIITALSIQEDIAFLAISDTVADLAPLIEVRQEIKKAGRTRQPALLPRDERGTETIIVEVALCLDEIPTFIQANSWKTNRVASDV